MFCEPTFRGKLTQEMTNKRDLIGSQKRANQRLSMILGAISELSRIPGRVCDSWTHTPNTLSQTKWLVRPRPRAFPSPPRPGRRRRTRTARDSRRRDHATRLPFLDFLRFRVTKKPPPLTPSSPFHVKRQARAIFLPVSAASAVRPAACPPAACPACPPALPST